MVYGNPVWDGRVVNRMPVLTPPDLFRGEKYASAPKESRPFSGGDRASIGFVESGKGRELGAEVAGRGS